MVGIAPRWVLPALNWGQNSNFIADLPPFVKPTAHDHDALSRPLPPRRARLTSARAPALRAAQSPDCSPRTHGAQPVAVLRLAPSPGWRFGRGAKPPLPSSLSPPARRPR